MALGRHRAEVAAREARGSAVSDVVLWGAFITVATGVTMALFTIHFPAIAFVTAVLAGGFLLAWWLGSEDRANSSKRVPLSSSPIAPDFPTPAVKDMRGPMPDPVDPGSRWIATFGPPETGQLPIQRYIPDSGSAPSGAAGEVESGLPQWSHSRS